MIKNEEDLITACKADLSRMDIDFLHLGPKDQYHWRVDHVVTIMMFLMEKYGVSFKKTKDLEQNLVEMLEYCEPPKDVEHVYYNAEKCLVKYGRIKKELHTKEKTNE